MPTLSGWPAIQALTTTDLRLEPLRVAHADEMVGVLTDPELHTYTGGRPATLAQLRKRYRRQVSGRSSDGTQLWFNWVLRLRLDQHAIGFVQATVAARDQAVTAEVAWVVATAHQRRGYARQAVDAMLCWLRAYRPDHVVAHIHPEHRASQAIAARVGLKPTETVVDGEVRWTG